MLEYKHGGSGGVSIKGATAATALIAKVTDLSGTEHPRLKKVFDLYLALKLEIGREFQPDFEVFGDLKRDAKGKVESFGGAFKVGELFYSARKEGDTSGLKLVIDGKDRIPKDLLDALVGRKISYLRYVKGKKPDGKIRWVHWDIVGLPNKEKELLDYFQTKARKDQYLRKQWTPELLDENGSDVSFNPKEFATSTEDDGSF